MQQQQSEAEQKKVLDTLNPTRVIIPIIIGLGIAVWMFLRNVKIDDLVEHFASAQLHWIFIAFLVLLIRDGGYVYRIRYLTEKALSWKSSVYTILLWEFASAVTPSAVGGTAIAVFILNKEGIPFGKSLAYVMLTALLDNSFFLIAAPLAIFLSEGQVFPDEAAFGSVFSKGLQFTFWLSYFLIFIYNVFFSVGLLIRPQAFKWFLVTVTSIGFLKRFQKAAEESGDEVILASAQLKGMSFKYWFDCIFSTLLVWTARYFMVNCLLEAFTDISLGGHWLIFARHILMWIIMLISPTPGSSGTAEVTFEIFFEEFIGTFSTAVALFWRLFTYYPYLFIGAIILPRWLNRVRVKRE